MKRSSSNNSETSTRKARSAKTTTALFPGTDEPIIEMTTSGAAATINKTSSGSGKKKQSGKSKQVVKPTTNTNTNALSILQSLSSSGSNPALLTAIATALSGSTNNNANGNAANIAAASILSNASNGSGHINMNGENATLLSQVAASLTPAQIEAITALLPNGTANNLTTLTNGAVGPVNNEPAALFELATPTVSGTGGLIPALPPRTNNKSSPNVPKSSGKYQAATNRNIPAFLNKLYNMVNDPANFHYIRWSESGLSFIVHDQDELAKNVLPRYFKHNNFTSFIRQLNMYGFHKVQSVEQGSLLAGTQPEVFEFQNEYFQKDRPDLLCFVVRRKNLHNEDLVTENGVDLNNIIHEIAAIKRHQMTISAELQKIQRENQLVWQGSSQLEAKYAKQQETIDKILKFLASVFSGSKTVTSGSSRKKRRLLIEEASEIGTDAEEDESEEEVQKDNVDKRVSELLQQTFEPDSNMLPFPSPFADQQPLTILSEVPNASPPPSSNRIQQLQEAVNGIADDIDLLQDRIYDIPSLVGLKSGDGGVEDWNVESLIQQLNNNVQGTAEDHATLMALMQQHAASATSTAAFPATLDPTLDLLAQPLEDSASSLATTFAPPFSSSPVEAKNSLGVHELDKDLFPPISPAMPILTKTAESLKPPEHEELADDVFEEFFKDMDNEENSH